MACPGKPFCSRSAATPIFLDEEQQAHMNTHGCYGILTERVPWAHDPARRRILRKQLQLPPMRSLRQCLYGLSYA